MKLLSVDQMKALDAYNIEKEGGSSLELMERASRAVVDEIVTLLPSTNTRIVVFAGSGNNGGDGLAIARQLGRGGYKVEVYLLNTLHALSDNCQQNKKRLEESKNVVLHEITAQLDLPQLDSDDWIIDAIFGIGLNRQLTGGYKQLVEFINKSGNKVVAVDMPSGMIGVSQSDGDEEEEVVAVKADYTFTFHCMKPRMLLSDSQQYLGEIKVLDIGLDDSHIDYSSNRFTITGQQEAQAMLKPRDEYGNKGTFGYGLLLAGSRGMAGAAMLAGRAAYRSGLGKLCVHTAGANLPVLQAALPEAIVEPDKNEKFISEHCCNNNNYAAVAVGPGLGQNAESEEMFLSLLKHCKKPLIIDADGLNILAKQNNWAQLLPKGTILTPHPKEWGRLINKAVNSTAQVHLAMECCQKHGIYIVLKGHYTAVCTPEGRVFFNTSGNSGMATAGSGDALTGILLALRCQGYSAEVACRLGVWIHGYAGECASQELTEYSVVTSDIINNLGKAFKSLIN